MKKIRKGHTDIERARLTHMPPKKNDGGYTYRQGTQKLRKLQIWKPLLGDNR
jgi:hypothetical protein